MLEESDEEKENENFNLHLSDDEEMEDLLPNNSTEQNLLCKKNCVNHRNYK